MTTQPKDQQEDKNKKPLDPDPETLHTTDPQEEMKGPLSSLVQGAKKGVEENDKESKEEADEKKEKNI